VFFEPRNLFRNARVSVSSVLFGWFIQMAIFQCDIPWGFWWSSVVHGDFSMGILHFSGVDSGFGTVQAHAWQGHQKGSKSCLAESKFSLRLVTSCYILFIDMNLYSSSVQCRAKFTPVEWYLAVAVAWFSTLTKSRNLWRGVPVSSFVLPLQGWYDKTHGARLPQEPSWIQLTQRTWEVHFLFSGAKKGTHFVANMWNVRVLEWIPLAQAPCKPNLSAWFLCPTDFTASSDFRTIGVWKYETIRFLMFFGVEKFDPDPEWPRYFMIFPQTECWLPCFSCDRFSRNPWLTGTIDATPESGNLVPHRWSWKLGSAKSTVPTLCSDAKICQSAVWNPGLYFQRHSVPWCSPEAWKRSSWV
jgi:hypothetical protein